MGSPRLPSEKRDPIVITGQAKTYQASLPSIDEEPTKDHVQILSWSDFSSLLRKTQAEEAASTPRGDHDAWLFAAYDPRPSIVDAAVSLVAASEDPGLLSALAEEDELEALTDQLIAHVHAAAAEKEHRLILVTGVPGSGKTLVGLRFAHDRTVVDRLRELDSPPLYLTGNGPLVKVLVEALARDFRKRQEVTAAEARRKAGLLVKLVHSFTRDGMADEQSLQVPHVAVFDEGQRVWDSQQMARKHAISTTLGASEPETILRRLETRDWSVVVVLVGEGQEINTGELGAPLWLDAANTAAGSTRTWRAWIPQGISAPPSLGAHTDPSLHLRKTRRSIGAQDMSDWVECLLTNKPQEANALATKMASQPTPFPLLITRSLEDARSWLRERANRARCGIVASSRSARLRHYGIETQAEFQSGIDWPKWFLDPPSSIDSSSMLEIAATEFKCQGLEVDYVGLAWSWDMLRSGDNWTVSRLNRGEWRPVKGDRFRFGINAYRVLLTRARKGLVIWVPRGDSTDTTRPTAPMEDLVQYLRACGVTWLEGTW